MNPKRLPILSAVLILMIAMLACDLTTPSATEPTASAGSAISQTLTAIVPTTPPQSAAPTATPVPQSASPTATPVPPTATATPTEPPVTARAPEMRIAYTDAGRNLWIWIDGTGAARKIVSTGDVTEARISPDGNLVVFVRTFNYLNFSMWLINADGTNERLLIPLEEFDAMKNSPDALGAQPYVWDWVPGTRQLAIVSSPTHDGPGMMVNDDLWYVNIDTGELKQMLPPGQGGVFYFSPDGQQIALVTPKTISLINSDGTNRRQSVLEYPLVSTYGEYKYYATPKWSPDLSFLRVAILPQEPLAEPRQNTSIWEIPADGSPAKMIRVVTSMPLLGPELSPDLNHIVYLKEHGAPADNQRELHISVSDNSGDTIYQTGQLDFMGWAPDSSRFIFSSGTDNKAKLGQIGQAAVPFSDVDPVMAVSWLKDGKVIFLHRTSSSWEIRIGAPGGASEALVSLPGDPDKFIPNFAIYE